MIWGTKDMIAGCIERMRESGCDGCERGDACASLFKALGWGRPGEERRTGTATPFLAFLAEVAKALEPRPRESEFRRDIEARLEPMLATGTIRIDQVARQLGLSRQTLYRRLKAEGVTFAGLLDSLRRRLALRYLREDGVPVKDAAYRLGFSDPAAFSRAFKRWTGKSPRDVRR